MGKRTRIAAIAVMLGMGLLLGASVAGAMPASVKKQIESSLLVKGSVDIEPDGSVSAVAIEREEKLPPGVVKFVRDSGLQWRFEPVLRDGHAVQARSPMSLRVVAQKLDNGDYRISLRGASFERYDPQDPTRATSIKITPPKYPDRAARAGAGGSVYLLVKVGRDGNVEDAIAEQVNLRILAPEGEMRLLRDMFAKNAVAAAKGWTFRVPTEGDTATRSFWNVRVPVTYSLDSQAIESRDGDYGRWISYIPGPRQQAPWMPGKERAEFSPDTLADGGVYMADSSAPRLLTPLQGG